MSVNRKAGSAWKSTRHDRWYTLAKEQGWRSRAAFKLIQLNKKYNFLSSARSVLDLGAAPGGWLQVCVKTMPVSSMIIGVDLVPIKSLRGATTIQADITSSECRSLVKKELQGWDVDLVLHDGAPNVAGGMVWSKDAYQQNELVLHSLRLATHFMRPSASFVTKVFRSQDYNSLLWLLQQLFASVDVTKPLASRNASAEIFIVCRGYKAPKRIDPHLLDPAFVFQQFEAEGKNAAGVVDVFAKQRRKAARSRQGYAETETERGLIGTRCDVMTFIDSEEPIATLGSYTAFDFTTDRSMLLLSSGIVDDDVKALCDDLKVLGKGDFKSLLRWRKSVRDWVKELKKEEGTKAEQEGKTEGEEAKKEQEKTEEEMAAEEEQRLSAAIDELKQRQLHRKRQERRKKQTIKQKQQQRLLLNKNNLTDVQEMIGADVNDELFNLSSVTGGVMDLLESKAGEEVEEVQDEDESEKQDGREGEEDSEDESRYVFTLERNLESMYEQYKERRKIVERIKGKEVAAVMAMEEATGADQGKDASSDEEAEDEEEDVSDEETYQQMKVGMKRKREQVGADENITERNPLLQPLAKQEEDRASERAERWFQRAIFSSAHLQEKKEKQEDPDKGETEAADLENVEEKTGKRTLMDMMARGVPTDSSEDESEDGEDDEDGRWLGDEESSGEEDGGQARPQRVKDRRLHGLDSLSKTREQVEMEAKRRDKRAKKNIREERRLQRKEEKEEKEENDSTFSSMLQRDNDDEHMLVDEDSKKKAKRLQKRAERLSGITSQPSSSSFEEVPADIDPLSSDDDAVATTLALATRMLQKRQRVAVLDSSYNRYAVDTTEQALLPPWFRAEESSHMVAQLPVTKAEVNQFKDRLKAINARPIRKIAEARMRKKVRTERRWEKIAKKVEEMQKEGDGAAAAEGGGSVGEKLKRMESLMRKKDKRSVRGDRKYIVTRKGGGTDEVKRKKGSRKTGGLTVQVDRRLKKDKRGKKVAEKRGKKKQSISNKRKRNV